MTVPDPARVDNVARLGLAQQEALDALSDQLVANVLLDGEAVLGGNHALVEAELLAEAVVAGYFLGANVVSMELCVDQGDSL